MNKAYTYELNLLGGVLSMALKLSLPLSMSAYLQRIALYDEHVKSKCPLPCLHCILYTPSNLLDFDTMMQLQYLTCEIECVKGGDHINNVWKSKLECGQMQWIVSKCHHHTPL